MALSRRGFLRNGLIAVSLGVAPPSFLLRAAHAKPAAIETLRARAGRTLVVIELAGGNDALNMLVPYADEAYYRARPTLGIRREEAIVLTNELALHPAMGPLAELYQSGKVAAIQGVGYPNPTFSHFRAMEIIKSGVPEGYEPIGWLGRYLDQVAEPEEYFAAAAIGNRLDHTLNSEQIPVPVIQNANAYAIQTDPRFEGDRTNRLNAFTMLNQGDEHGRAMVPLIQDTAQAAYLSSRELADFVSAYRTTVEYPAQNGLATGLRLLAQVITADVGLHVGYVTIGGFDTHAGQTNTHRNLLTQAASAIRAFQDDLEAQGVADKVLILTTSEFGRRVNENGSGGTDHGSAATFLAVGAGVKGGIYGERPSLTDLDRGNFKYTTDFRAVYSTLLSGWLGHNPAPVLGKDWGNLGFVA